MEYIKYGYNLFFAHAQLGKVPIYIYIIIRGK